MLILLAEDDVLIAQHVIKQLRLQQHDVNWVKSREALLHLISIKSFDLLLTNIALRDSQLNYHDFYTIRQRGRQNLKIAVLSAYKPIKLPAVNNWLEKPFSERSLQQFLLNV